MPRESFVGEGGGGGGWGERAPAKV
jgi:hypothetical protein